MNVCYIGGTGSYLAELASAVAAAGHDVTVLAFYDSTMGEFYDPRRWIGVKAVEIPRKLKWRLVRGSRQIRALLRSIDASVLHCHYAFPYGLYGGLARHPGFVLSLHGSDAYYSAWRISSPTTRRLDRVGIGPIIFGTAHSFLANTTRRVIVGSPDLVEVARRLGYREALIRRCDIGVDTQLFNPERRSSELRRQLLSPFAEGHLLFCARAFKPVYAPLDLVHALRKVVGEVPSTVLVFAEDGLERPMVEKEVRSLGLQRNVKFIGMVPHGEIGRYLSSSDVLCSVALSDTTSMTVLEGMASGLPILATRVGSIPDRLSKTRGGILVPPGDVDAIAEGILSLLGNPTLRSRMGARNADFMSHHLSFRETVERHLAVYEEVAEEGGNPG